MSNEPDTYEEFQASFQLKTPPVAWRKAIKALWYDAKDEWEKAHTIAEAMDDELGSWVHAYLHRKEGDRFNAGYWYRRAGKVFPEMSLELEHQRIFHAIINS